MKKSKRDGIFHKCMELTLAWLASQVQLSFMLEKNDGLQLEIRHLFLFCSLYKFKTLVLKKLRIPRDKLLDRHSNSVIGCSN